MSNSSSQIDGPQPALQAESSGGVEKFAFPATPQQQQLWFLDLLNPGNPAYNIPLAYELRGQLDPDALDKSLSFVVNRHETFRTTFEIRDDDYCQVVSSRLEIGFHRLDLRSLPEAERKRECARAVSEAARIRFDIEDGPLVRGDLIVLGERSSVIAFNFHHLIVDHLSILQFAREFSEAYRYFSRGGRPEVDPPPLQYPDFAVWQDGQFEAPRFQADLSKWVDSLGAGHLPSTVPADRRRPRAQSFNGAEVRFSFSPELSRRIRQLAQGSKRSTYVTLLTLFKCLLARYSGHHDVIVGSPFSNRMLPELEGVMGCCMNTLPLRSSLPESAPFARAMEVVHQSMLSAYSRQQVPLKLIVDAARPERDPSMNPLFQCTFTLQDPPMSIGLDGLDVEPLCVHNDTSKFDMAVWMWDSDGKLSGLWEYNVDLYDPETIDRLISNFRRLAESAVATPDANWDQLKMVAPDEVRLLRDEFNKTGKAWDGETSLVRIVEAAARKRPDDVALVCGNRRLTYRELTARASALSVELRKRGVGRQSLVGLSIDRSLDMVVAMLAILDADAAYVPLDLTFPPGRLAFMVDDSGLGLIVTNAATAPRVSKFAVPTIIMDETLAGPDAAGGLGTVADPDSLAYVRYTSGSTGKPKGVEVPMRALVNFLLSMRERPGFTSGDVLLAVTTLSFDISELEIWLPLISGGTVVLASREQAIDGSELLRLIRKNRVTVMQATPATWRLLLDAGWTGEEGFKALCGGESLPSDLASQIMVRSGELWNMYGPTETTVWSTCARLDSPESIHVGRPVANTELHIVDAHLRPVPVGVAGELLIGGDGLACGYHNRPALTGEKFIPNPFKPGGRLYRTGDLALYRPNGNVVCVGRLDSQVKVRGYRVELGEIETLIAEVPDVKQAVAAVSDERLMSYYVTRSGNSIDEATLRDALRAALPEYMVPASYVLLSEIPLTPNGKVDRRALPEVSGGPAATGHTYVAPKNETERTLVSILEETLQRGNIGVRDNFFEIGGHSLLAARFFNRIEIAFGRRLPLASLFQNPTVDQLARLLGTDENQGASWNSLVPIREGKGGPSVFLVHGAGGNILIYRELARYLLPGVSVFGLQSLGLDGRKEPIRTVEEMATRYVGEILQREPGGPYVLGGYCMGGKVALEIARQLREQGRSVAMLAMLDSFNLNFKNRASFPSTRLSTAFQLISFHAGNMAWLGPRKIWPYLIEKARMAREAAAGRLRARYRKLRAPRSGASTGGGAITDSIQSVNDNAGFRYVPGRYSGPATLFKPRRNYSAFNDEKMGWGAVLEGKVEVVELDMNPHAMLVDPFVRLLAGAINQRLMRLYPDGDSVEPVGDPNPDLP